MNWTQFIFSDKRNYSTARHLLFWAVWWVYFVVLHAANPFGKPEISYFLNPVYTLTEATFFVFAQLPLAYSMWYIILPRFMLRKKYLLSFVSTALLWFLGGVWTWYLMTYAIPYILANFLPAHYIANTERPPSASFVMAVMGTYKGAFTITAIGFVIKFAKHWYQKEQRNLQLQKEKSEAQLQLLTAQIHPHFLFNTLNNIFSQTQTESPKGSKMIMGLSDMLRYILYEGQKPLVPLKQEVEMIREYINLEKIRYGNKLDVHVSSPTNMEDIYIAPLLLLPFVENSFKHGTSKILQDPWISLSLELNDSRLIMKLMNGKTRLLDKATRNSGIGIQNVRQRLELLYKGQHQMLITEDNEVFVVDLEVELARCTDTSPIIKTPKNSAAYA